MAPILPELPVEPAEESDEWDLEPVFNCRLCGKVLGLAENYWWHRTESETELGYVIIHYYCSKSHLFEDVVRKVNGNGI